MKDVSARLAAFATETQSFPASTLHAGRRTILNSVALSVGAANHPAARVAIEALQALERPNEVTVLGSRERLGLLDAPLVNGLTAHVEDFDDTHLETVIHPGAPIVPAALAAAEWVGASGSDTLAAVVCGIEVALRVGTGITPGHFDRGWHLTSTTGRLGAAVAAGRLLELTEGQMLAALGIGAGAAAGLQEALGTMTKAFHPGKAASDGLEASLLARRGFTGPERSIEGRRGFAETAAPAPDYERMVDGLGKVWETERNTFKPYACGIVSHPAIDTAIALREKVAAENVEAVELTVNPVVLDVMGVQEPRDGLQSKFSVYHCFASAFLDGAGGPAQYSDSRAVAPDVVGLRRRVRTVLDPTVEKHQARARLWTTSGEELEHIVEDATGSEEAPMTDDQLRDKVRLVAQPAIGARTEDLIEAVFAMDSLASIEGLLRTTRPEEGPGA